MITNAIPWFPPAATIPQAPLVLDLAFGPVLAAAALLSFVALIALVVRSEKAGRRLYRRPPAVRGRPAYGRP
jgi:hypothetical protein